MNYQLILKDCWMDGDLECEANAIAILVNNSTVSIKAHNDVSPAGHLCFVLDTGHLFGLKKFLMYDQEKSFK